MLLDELLLGDDRWHKNPDILFLDVVFLVSILDEIFITDSWISLNTFLSNYVHDDDSHSFFTKLPLTEDELEFFEKQKDKFSNTFLQEYESYEEAYDVALDMKETNKLCYSKSDKNINDKNFSIN